jgi:AcrR family transcriptional regulator
VRCQPPSADIKSSNPPRCLFDAHGYRNTSLEDVALLVSIAKPTLYHYFQSKEEILRFIHEEFIQLLTEKYLQRVGSGVEPEELVLGAMKDILSLMVSHRGYVSVFFEHRRELPPRRIATRPRSVTATNPSCSRHQRRPGPRDFRR